MTAFVLVSGPFTGGWVWRETAARLRREGAEAHAVTLTGLGDRRHLAGPGTDLETHIADVLQVIEHADAPEVVLVGHDYAIHPVLAAADRRPDRVSRVVYLDAGMPQNGDAALALVPLQAVRDGLAEWQKERTIGETDTRLPAPTPDEWRLWGSTDGLAPDVLAMMTRLAAPHPEGTLVEPLRLSGAVDEIPATGVLCTSSGTTIALLESLTGLGDPRLVSLVERRVTFFELATGHWPMLSAPDELAKVLIGAAAGEGHVMTAGAREEPAHLRPFLLDVPPQPRERIGAVDLHFPDDETPRPAVVFVHGGPVPPDARPTPRDWPALVGHAQLAASLGAVGATVDHRLHGLGDYEQAAADVVEAVARVRAHPRVDGDRVALWFFSGGGLLTTDWLAAPPDWLRCLAASYPILAPLPNWGLGDSRFHPADAVRTAGRLPIVVTRVGLEHEAIAATVAGFLSAAKEAGAEIEVVDVPHGHHGFETIDHTDEARAAVQDAMRSVLRHLGG